MDTAQWPQGIGVFTPMETSRASMLERRGRSQKGEVLNCPRCNSSNTKFCYYNNYSLSQPRYFCKTCRRYWTEGGSLRNVPVGGGSRKNKRSSSSSRNPKIHQGQVNLAYPPPTEDYKNLSKLAQSQPQSQNPSLTSTRFNLNSIDLSSFSNTVSDSNNSSGFPMQYDFKPTFNFRMDGFGDLQSTNELDQNQSRNRGETTGYWFYK